MLGYGGWALPPALPGHYLTLEVMDSGSGMKPEELARAFDPFFTTKFTGRGLGLAAEIGIPRSHGGGVQARSEAGHDASFKIYLPAMLGERSLKCGEALPLGWEKGPIPTQGRLRVPRNPFRDRRHLYSMRKEAPHVGDPAGLGDHLADSAPEPFVVVLLLTWLGG